MRALHLRVVDLGSPPRQLGADLFGFLDEGILLGDECREPFAGLMLELRDQLTETAVLGEQLQVGPDLQIELAAVLADKIRVLPLKEISE
jgi:hypothetical protein